MSPEEIVRMAARAAAFVRRRYDLYWSQDEWKDVRQAAGEGIVYAMREKADQKPGYYWVSAVQSATRCAFREIAKCTDLRTWSLSLDQIEAMEQLHEECDAYQPRWLVEPIQRKCWIYPITDDDIPALRAMLTKAPRRTGARGGPKTRDHVAVARDIRILEGLSEGLSRDVLASRLGMSRNDLNGYIGVLRKRLQRIADQLADSVER